jgi:hypothetical protein
LRVRRTHERAPKPDGLLKSEDGSDVVRLPSTVLTRTFQKGLWDEINSVCGTNIDAYELVWLETANLAKAANLIRQSLGQDKDAPSDYVECLVGAAEMLEVCAGRHLRVMFSF